MISSKYGSVWQCLTFTSLTSYLLPATWFDLVKRAFWANVNGLVNWPDSLLGCAFDLNFHALTSRNVTSTLNRQSIYVKLISSKFAKYNVQLNNFSVAVVVITVIFFKMLLVLICTDLKSEKIINKIYIQSMLGNLKNAHYCLLGNLFVKSILHDKGLLSDLTVSKSCS